MAGSDGQWPGWARWGVLDELSAVEAELDRERASNLTARSTGATDAQLTCVSDWVRSTRDQVSSGASGDDVLAAPTSSATSPGSGRPRHPSPAPGRRGPDLFRGGRQ